MYQEVLVVEDDLADADLIVSGLSEAATDLTIQVSTSVGDAYISLFGMGTETNRTCVHQPQLIFFSLNLLDTGGIELLQLLKIYSPMRSIPIVLLKKGNVDTHILEDRRIVALGIKSFIAKSDNSKQFVRQIGAT